MLTDKNIRNIFIYAAPLFAGYGLNLLILPLLTRLLSPAEFGVATLAWAFPTLAVSIITCGLSSSAQRYYFEYRTEPVKLNALLFSSQVFLYLLLVLSSIVVYLFRDGISRVTMLSSDYGTAVFIAFVAGYFAQIKGFYLVLYQNMEQATAYSSFTLLQAGLTAVSSLLLIWYFKMSYMGMLYGSLIGNAAVCAIILFHFNKSGKSVFNGKILGEAVLYGLQVVPKSLTGFVNKFFDKYMLNNMLSLSAVGIYNIGQSIGNMLFMLMNTVWSSFQPVSFREVFDKGDAATHSSGRLFTIFAFVALSPLMLVILFAQEIVYIVAPTSYYEAIDIIIIISGGIATQVFGMYIGVQYAYSKKAYWIFPITVLGTIANVLANILLVPRWGLIGAGLATVIMYFVTNGILTFIGQRLYRITYEWRTMISLCGIIIAAILTVLYLRMVDFSGISLYLIKLLFVCLYIGTGINAKIITRQSIRTVAGSLLAMQRDGS